jgi:hypothetical protein
MRWRWPAAGRRERLVKRLADVSPEGVSAAGRGRGLQRPAARQRQARPRQGEGAVASDEVPIELGPLRRQAIRSFGAAVCVDVGRLVCGSLEDPSLPIVHGMIDRLRRPHRAGS